MKSLYLFRCSSKDLNLRVSTQLIQKLRLKHPNLAIFCPIAHSDTQHVLQDLITHFKLEQDPRSSFGFEFEEGFKAYNENKDFFIDKIINDFENLKTQYDFVFVFGVHYFGILGAFEINVKLAKELNSPVYAVIQKDDYKMAENYLKLHLDNRAFTLIDEWSDVNSCEEIDDYNFLTPSRFRYELSVLAKKDIKTVVLPESDDDRIIKAAAELLSQKVVKLILLGKEENIMQKAKNLGLNLQGIQILDPQNSPLHDEFANILYEARKQKGLSLEEAHKLVLDKTFFGTLLVHTNKADAMVSGASTTTAETIRPALQLIKTKPNVKTVSGMFFMSLEDRLLVFADCAVTPNPTPEQIAEIAYSSAQTAKEFGLEPKVAILSYSSGDSGQGPSVDASKEALKIAREKYPDLNVDGPLQFDAAYDPLTAKGKMPNSKVAGFANVYVFPDLNAANIGYKAVQRTSGAIAIGPILQGLKKPVNDLSRGCLVDDIVNTVILSAIQARSNEK
ncbi:phosphate acetyltransferase [Campylobacter sp. MIT 99-7217]|uniref:phosphate acetyltransferase n=1 Tax=Campylobacter sp. MIT 99-7217 TaxID=535091 RepID=UPI00115AF3F9|nr:phosphate acetyltransferase [Campylobacter sp. MIT 99-7217]TQR33157.1 phosphate acetyltransferase [Campylobacter sp. MIT 99-7217]